MAPFTIIFLSLLSQLVSGHFSIEYPPWRGDSFADGASQYIYPCANVNTTASTNRTVWPTTGGSLSIDFHHPFTYVFINLGLGSVPALYNISLNALPLNETGNGTLCLPHLQLPADPNILDGKDATIQISTVGPTGTALYNCADITFSSNATLLSGNQCKNDTGVSIVSLNQEINGSTVTSNEISSTTSALPAASSTGGSVNVFGQPYGPFVLSGILASVTMVGFSILS